uniref:Uncharacterized protein n=1 Tax=Plectus sambesii TaxID=2011161 RepID=A0A914VZP4_9BILA
MLFDANETHSAGKQLHPHQKTAKKQTKSSPKRIAKAKAVFVPKAETTINVELAAELEQDIRAAGDDQHEHEAGNMNVQLQLHMNHWPDTNEFIFIVRQEYFHGNTQTAAQTDTSEFDERFHLGCVQTGDNCRLADQIIRSILGTATYDVSQQMTQILAYVTGGSSIEPLKASKDIFYDFVLRTVAETLSTKAIQHRLERDPQRHSEQSDSHATAHADSISQLLAAEIGRYCSRLQQQGQSQADDDSDRLCMLKCQLSLFDIDFLADFTLTVGQVDDRFKWATRQLDLIASLSTSDASLQRWLANTIAYLCEFVGRVVASRLARKAKMLSAGGSMSVAEPKKRNEEERMATWLAKDMVSVAAHLHATLSGAISTPAGASEIDRLEAATQLLIPLEEEMERVLDMMARLDDNRRDMARQRAPINEAWGSVQAIGRSIEALSLEGVIEAGNTEALRDLCRQVGDAAEKLQQQIDELQ